MTRARPALLVSACLLGRRVRYNGRHARHPAAAGVLARRFELIPVCPEVEAGMPTPRPPVELAGNPAAPRAVYVDSPKRSVTRRLTSASRRLARELSICGAVLKSGSPSCGLRVKVARGPDGGGGWSMGLFASALRSAQPGLPVIEETALDDRAALARFMDRAMSRWTRGQRNRTR